MDRSVFGFYQMDWSGTLEGPTMGRIVINRFYTLWLTCPFWCKWFIPVIDQVWCKMNYINGFCVMTAYLRLEHYFQAYSMSVIQI